jgi:acyl dehydratase
MPMPSPRPRRYFEDFPPGAVFEAGNVTVSEAEIVEFATRYDPQPFHIDADAAQDSIYGGLIASGWHTSALMMRQLVDGVIGETAALGSPGVDELRWLLPVRPGDTLSVRLTVTEARVSRSKPDRGLVRCRFEVTNQAGVLVMQMHGLMFVYCRPPA